MGDSGPDRLTISDAARRLGITETAVAKRIQRGRLASELDADGRRWVLLPSGPVATGQDVSGHGQDSASGPPGHPPESTERVAELLTHIASLEREIERLWGQIEAMREERRRQDMILLEAIRRAPELPAGDGETRHPLGPDTERRPWWRRWG